MGLPKRALGASGLEVSALGLGCMALSEIYTRPASDEEGIAVIHRALDLGVNFFDTADMYGVGMNELLLGRALRGHRARAVVATKFGNQRGLDGGFLGVNGRPEYARAACAMSLRRLGIETIDLYYLHRVDPKVPIEETVGGMARLAEEGKVRYLGLSEASAETLRRAHRTHPIAALQSEYSLWSRDPEQATLAACRELGVGFVAYSPLGRGFLAGNIHSSADLAPNDWRRRLPRFQSEAIPANLALSERLAALAREKSRRQPCTPSQLALAWLLAQGHDIVPIPGTKQVKYLEENVAATTIALTPEEVAAISAALPPGAAAGARYPEGGMAAVNR